MSDMEIVRAETAGFCMGVDLALRKLDRSVESRPGGGRIYTLGPIIHNPQVLAHYAEKGVAQAREVEEIPDASLVLIRAHGVPLELQRKLEARRLDVVDATCPKVKKAQTLIAGQSAQGRRLLLFGDKSHPEVQGLLSYAGDNAAVFESLEELMHLRLDSGRDHFAAAQTTQHRTEFNLVVQELRKRLGPGMPAFDTICDTTRKRQEEALRIAAEVELMVVVGGADSGNTQRLARVVADQGVESVHVESDEDLPLQRFRGRKRVGLTAGASTPSWIIDAVERRLRSL
jgi:4-hydroxy-3-methylbut-2-enyl diphosphate reductase